MHIVLVYTSLIVCINSPARASRCYRAPLLGEMAGHDATTIWFKTYYAITACRAILDRRGAILEAGKHIVGTSRVASPPTTATCPFIPVVMIHASRKQAQEPSKPPRINITGHTRRAAPHAALANSSQRWPACVSQRRAGRSTRECLRTPRLKPIGRRGQHRWQR